MTPDAGATPQLLSLEYVPLVRFLALEVGKLPMYAGEERSVEASDHFVQSFAQVCCGSVAFA
jgi:hypothetical protein